MMHFAKEADADRKRFLSAIRVTEIKTRIYYSTNPADAVARPQLLADLVRDLGAVRADRLILEERKDHQNQVDRSVIAKANDNQHHFTYGHHHASEPLLWVADAVAWCYGRPDWRGLVVDLAELAPKQR